jgi:putative two-component system response regulator
MRILLVDDNNTNLAILTKLVERMEGFEALAYSLPDQVLSDLPELDFDIAVIDYQMPVYNGVDLITEFVRFDKYKDKPFVIVTADTDAQTRMAALNAGAIDFLTKPINPLEFKARIKNLAALTDARNKLTDKAAWLRAEIESATEELREREQEIIHRLTLAAGYREPETAKHTLRVGLYAGAIAKAYGLSAKFCDDLRLAAPMHDVGKVGIPDAILLKQAGLSAGEYEVMQTHTMLGFEILSASKSGLLQLAAEIAASHHERWDGQGYPSRLSGEDIPLSGRIVTIADIFDALTTARPYKEPWTFEATVDYIKDHAGRNFDPKCVAAFVEALPMIIEIAGVHGIENQPGLWNKAVA